MTVPNQTLQIQNSEKFYVRKIRLNSGGYTSQGYYYGTGAPLYECYNDNEYYTFRANDRSHAIEQLRDLNHNVKVHREHN